MPDTPLSTEPVRLGELSLNWLAEITQRAAINIRPVALTPQVVASLLAEVRKARNAEAMLGAYLALAAAVGAMVTLLAVIVAEATPVR